MRSWVLRGIGNIRFEDSDVPVPRPGEVRVRVEAAGVCGSDIPRIYETGAHKMPLIPGHEFSGVVEENGDRVSNDLLGKRIGVFPLIPCGKCRPCKNGHPEMCRDYDYIGSRRDGAFAEYVTVPASNLIELPGEVSFEEAAMLEPMAVAVHAMGIGLGSVTGIPERDLNIVVCGLGTIGLLLVMFLKERGLSRIYVIGNKDSQRERAGALGIPSENYCSSAEGPAEWIRERIGGADVFFECVGRNETLRYGIDASAPGGRVVLVGNPYSAMTLERDIYWKILRNQLTVQGTWNSSFSFNAGKEGAVAPEDDWHYVLERLRSGRIIPRQFITHRFMIDRLQYGFQIMRDKSEDYCKVMMVRG